MKIIPSNESPVCSKYSATPRPAQTRMPCSLFYNADQSTLKQYRCDADTGLPLVSIPSVCLNNDVVITQCGVETIGRGGDTGAYQNTYFQGGHGMYSPECAFNAKNSADEIATPEWKKAYDNYISRRDQEDEKNNKTITNNTPPGLRASTNNIPETPPNGGCYIKNSFPACSSVDKFQQDLQISMESLTQMYQNNFSSTSSSIGSLNCLSFYADGCVFEGNVIIDQSIKIKTVTESFISALSSMDIVNTFKAIIKTQLEFINDTYLSGCKTRVPSPITPPSLNVDIGNVIDGIFEEESFQASVINTIQNIHSCNIIKITLRNSVIKGNFLVDQSIVIDSYISSCIDAVMEMVVKHEEIAEIIADIVLTKTTRYTEEEISGKKDSYIPLIITVIVVVLIGSFGFTALLKSMQSSRRKKLKNV